MTLAFDLYLARRSPLHRLDPRVKIILLAAGTIVLLAMQNLFVCLAWLLVNHFLFLAARVPLTRLRVLWAAMLPLSLLVFVTWPLVYQEGGAVLLAFWRVKITALSVVPNRSLMAGNKMMA